MPNSTKLIKTLLLICILIGSKTSIAQDSTKTRYLLNIPPLQAFKKNPITYTHGLSFGLWNLPFSNKTITNGINFEIIGYGWTTPILGFDDSNSIQNHIQTTNGFSVGGLTLLGQKVNGISFSTFIATVKQTNGIQLSLFNFTGKCNGIQLGITNYAMNVNGTSIGILNWSQKSSGIQIGLVNKTKNLKGFQFGLLNINSKRILPLVNWSLKKKN